MIKPISVKDRLSDLLEEKTLIGILEVMREITDEKSKDTRHPSLVSTAEAEETRRQWAHCTDCLEGCVLSIEIFIKDRRWKESTI